MAVCLHPRYAWVIMRTVESTLTRAFGVVGAVVSLLACGDDTSGAGGGGPGSTGATSATPASAGAGGDGASSTASAGGDAASTTTLASTGSTSSSTSGAGGEGGAPPVLGRWPSTTERCDGAIDEDVDGAIDEDCPESLFGGIFDPAGVGLTEPSVFDGIESWTDRKLAVIQTYRSTSEAGAANAKLDLAAIWARESTPHLNVEPLGYAPSQFEAAGADPELAADVEAMATAVAEALADAPGHSLLLTFGAEMNGDWTDWGCLPPSTFIAFYRWAHGVFDDALAARSPAIDPRRVRWVFGPNNVSSGGCAAPSAYYPGHDFNDYVGMSSYRSGDQSVASAVLDPAHALLDDLALSPELQVDRFIVLQTGTRAVPGDNRDQWVRDLFADLTSDPVFRGVIYFNGADWAFVWPGPLDGITFVPGFVGLIDGLMASPPADRRLEGTFDPYFWDVPTSHPSYPEIQSLRAAGLTSGCASSPPRFCPEAVLTRADAAVLLGRTFAIAPDAGAPIFDDVPTDAPAFGFVQALAAQGVLEGCGPASFCPAAPITRGDLARALVRLTTATLPPTAQVPYGDLDAVGEDGAIQIFGNLDLVDGCELSRFCPDDPTRRDVGARWIVRVGGVPEAARVGG